jgi:hypothetical protein
MHGPIASLHEHEEARVELMQVPTQPLLDPSPFVYEILGVINEQLQLPKRLLVRAGRLRQGSRSANLATASASIGTDLAALPGSAPSGGTRTSCSPAAFSSRSSARVRRGQHHHDASATSS